MIMRTRRPRAKTSLIATIISALGLVLAVVVVQSAPKTPITNITADATLIPISHVIVLGDSISASSGSWHYTTLIKTHLDSVQPKQVQLINTAVGGSKAPDLSKQLDAAIPKLGSSVAGKVLIVITVGANDIYQDVRLNGDITVESINNFDRNYRNFLQYTQSRSGIFPHGYAIYQMDLYDTTDGTGVASTCTIVFPNFTDPINKFKLILSTYHGLESVAPGKIHIVPIYQTFLGHGYEFNNPSNPYYHPDDPTRWLMDCIHPNFTGHAAIAASFNKSIDKYEESAPTTPPTSPPTTPPTQTPSISIRPSDTSSPTPSETPTLTNTKPSVTVSVQSTSSPTHIVAETGFKDEPLLLVGGILYAIGVAAFVSARYFGAARRKM